MWMRAGAAAAIMVLVAGPGVANGLGESGSWQFETTTDKGNRANIAAVISKERAGYGPGDTNVTYNVRGDMVNCNLNSTAAGNTASTTQDAPIGSPDVTLSSSVDSGATGNRADNATTGGSTDASVSGGGLVDSAVGIGDTTTQTADNSTALNSDQANAGSQLSTIGNVSSDYALAGLNATGGGGQANLNNTQTTTGSSLVSEVTDSTACQFQKMNGNVGSPINAVDEGN